MKEIVLADYSGGLANREAATDFSDRQWAKLYGVVLESGSEARTQWGWQKIGAAGDYVNLGVVDDLLVAQTSTGEFFTATAPDADVAWDLTDDVAWTTLSVTDTNLEPISVIPLRSTSSQGFIAGLLLNGVASTGNARVVYRDPTTSNPTVAAYTDRYPANDTADGMPRGDVATMWGDYLVLGDCHWLDDDTAAYASGNTKRYPHLLWFSKAGKPFRWDTLDTLFMGVKSASQTEVHAIIPLDVGLLVLTVAGIYLLRGNPADHDYEELRVGAKVASRRACRWWPHTGAAAWVDIYGGVWHTDGEEFLRLDEPLRLGRDPGAYDQVCPMGEYLLVLREGRLFAFRAFEDRGAWTELHVPATLTRLIGADEFTYAIDDAGQVWRLNRSLDTERGMVAGTLFEVAVATRTLETGDGHRRSGWHRFGVRVDKNEGTPRILRATIRPGPALDTTQPTMVVRIGRKVESRDAVVVPGHGHTSEASVEWTFEGDVSVEQVTAWVHEGRDDR